MRVKKPKFRQRQSQKYQKRKQVKESIQLKIGNLVDEKPSAFLRKVTKSAQCGKNPYFYNNLHVHQFAEGCLNFSILTLQFNTYTYHWAFLH